MNGKGELIYQENKKYVGNFLDDQRSGYGTQMWENGNLYIGYWENDMQHGKGIEIDINGEKLCGVWQNGELKQELEEEDLPTTFRSLNQSINVCANNLILE